MSNNETELGEYRRLINEAYDPELMRRILADFQEAGILGDGEVNYEVKYGLVEE